MEAVLEACASRKSIAFDRETLSVAATTLPGNQARLGETRRNQPDGAESRRDYMASYPSHAGRRQLTGKINNYISSFIDIKHRHVPPPAPAWGLIAAAAPNRAGMVPWQHHATVSRSMNTARDTVSFCSRFATPEDFE